jgi:ribose transport system permease protein
VGKLAALRNVDPSRYIVYVGFILILVGFSVVLWDDGFLTTRNLLNIVQQTAPVTIMAIGMVFVLTAGEIDLSVGSIVAISALLCAMVLRENFWFLGATAGLAAGAAIGAVNGLLVAYMRLPSFLVTLATMGFLAGVARWLTDLQSVPITNNIFTGLFGGGNIVGIPSLVIWTLAVAAFGHFVYRESRYGAHVHAVGDNATAARAVGIRVDRIRFSVMALSGLCAGLAGILYAGRLHGARYTLGETDLLTVIAAVIVGGTRLNGGIGTILGAVVGSLLMGMLNNGLILMGLSVSEQLMVRGLIILAAIALTLREKRR